MSEYTRKTMLWQNQIGAPPGYVGYDDGQTGSGQLVNRTRKTIQIAVILFVRSCKKTHKECDDNIATSNG